jgi:hypothetical protein
MLLALLVLSDRFGEREFSFFEVQFHLRRSTEDGGPPIIEFVFPPSDHDCREAVADEIRGGATHGEKSKN